MASGDVSSEALCAQISHSEFSFLSWCNACIIIIIIIIIIHNYTLPAATEDASLRKILKYTRVRQKYDFIAIAVETLGPINEELRMGRIFRGKLVSA